MTGGDSTTSARACYGRIGDREECRDCGVHAACADFACAERALAAGNSRIVGVPEWIPNPPEAEPADLRRKYTEEDLRRVVRFFLTLTAEELRILQMRLGRPELSTEEIAQALGIDRKRLYAFFRRETSVLPGLTRMLYRQRQRAAAKFNRAHGGAAPTTAPGSRTGHQNRQLSNPNNKESSK